MFASRFGRSGIALGLVIGFAGLAKAEGPSDQPGEPKPMELPKTEIVVEDSVQAARAELGVVAELEAQVRSLESLHAQLSRERPKAVELQRVSRRLRVLRAQLGALWKQLDATLVVALRAPEQAAAQAAKAAPAKRKLLVARGR